MYMTLADQYILFNHLNKILQYNPDFHTLNHKKYTKQTVINRQMIIFNNIIADMTNSYIHFME